MQQETINKRELLKGTLGTIILQLLNNNDRLYGYEISQMVKARTDGELLVKEGSLYPALHKLEADGFISSEEEYIGKRVRKYYRLTKPGKKMALASVNELMAFMKTIQELLIPVNYVPAK
jgi:PadR family transcriptional regulator, regulatory protein PadR